MNDKNATNSAAGLSKREAQLISDSLEVEQVAAREAGALGVITRVMAQATLPYLDPKLPPGMLYSRKTGLYTVNIVPTTTKYGIPYGTIPRLVLAWICTEAVKTGDRTLLLGRSQRDFLQKIQLDDGGHDIARMREQCMRLFRAVVSIEYEDETGEGSRRLPITDSDMIFWSRASPDAASVWQSRLELTEQFYNEIKAHPVPIDMRAYYALSKSPMAMDVYAWLTYRMFVLRAGKKKVARVPWLGLKAQLGTALTDDAAGLSMFKFRFKQRLKEVLLFFPEAADHVKDEGTCLILTPCRPHLPESRR